LYTRIYDGSFICGRLSKPLFNRYIYTYDKSQTAFFGEEKIFFLSREEKWIIYMELLEVMYKIIRIMDFTFLKIVCKYWGTINFCYWLWTMVNKYKKYRSQPSKYNIDSYQYWSNNYTFESTMKSYWFYSSKGM